MSRSVNKVVDLMDDFTGQGLSVDDAAWRVVNYHKRLADVVADELGMYPSSDHRLAAFQRAYAKTGGRIFGYASGESAPAEVQEVAQAVKIAARRMVDEGKIPAERLDSVVDVRSIRRPVRLGKHGGEIWVVQDGWEEYNPIAVLEWSRKGGWWIRDLNTGEIVVSSVSQPDAVAFGSHFFHLKEIGGAAKTWSMIRSGRLKGRASGQTFKKSGPYMNDCPFCKTHNALIDERKDGKFVMVCRDCGSVFDHGKPGELVLIERKHRAGRAGGRSSKPIVSGMVEVSPGVYLTKDAAKRLAAQSWRKAKAAPKPEAKPKAKPKAAPKPEAKPKKKVYEKTKTEHKPLSKEPITPYGAKPGEVEWLFEWKEGGYNSVLAKTKGDAIRKAKKLGAPRPFYTKGKEGMPLANPFPGATKNMTRGLTPVEDTFAVATEEVQARFKHRFAGMFD